MTNRLETCHTLSTGNVYCLNFFFSLLLNYIFTTVLNLSNEVERYIYFYVYSQAAQYFSLN